MKEEYFKIFDEDRNEIGTASRSDVHRFGYWHETFHCWFVAKHENKDYIYLQLRSDAKQDYPNLLDITVAGHLTTEETVEDGVREIKEEVGLDVPFHDLKSLGVLQYCVTKEGFIDKELAHVFLYKSEHLLDDFVVQTEEVSGIYLAKFNDFSELWSGERETINVKGFKIDGDGKRNVSEETVGQERFVPHQISFYKEVIRKIKANL